MTIRDTHEDLRPPTSPVENALAATCNEDAVETKSALVDSERGATVQPSRLLWNLRGAIIVGHATLLESIRNRVLLVTLLFSLVLVAVSIAAASVSVGEQARLIIDVGLFFASAFGGLMAIVLTVSSFAGELRRHTSYVVLARPLSRGGFVFGKYLGVLCTMLMVVNILLFATAGTVWLFGEPIPAAFWGSVWLSAMEIAVIVAVALLFSTFATPSLAATYSAGMVIAGHLSADVTRFAQHLVHEGHFLGFVLQGASFILPDLHSLSLRTEAANALPIPASFLWIGSLYSCAYSAALLCVAIAVFHRRQVL